MHRQWGTQTPAEEACLERRRKNAAKSQTLFGGRRRAADGPVAPGPGLYAGLAPARGQHGNPGVLQRDLDSLASAGAGGDGVPGAAGRAQAPAQGKPLGLRARAGAGPDPLHRHELAAAVGGVRPGVVERAAHLDIPLRALCGGVCVSAAAGGDARPAL